MKRLAWMSLAVVLLVPQFAFAHGQKGPHGGQMLLSGPHRFEMVVKETTFEIYVLNLKRQVLPLKGITGSAIVHSDNDKRADNVALSVSGDHLVGNADLKKLGKAEVHASIVVDGKEAKVAFEFPPD
jgi:hypothetical protein